MVLAGVLCFLLGAISYFTNVDLDSFHEMALARETWASGVVPKQDLFAYTPTLPVVVHHEWGTGMALYAAAVASGLGGTGLLLLKHALVFGMAVGCFVTARRRGGPSALFAVLALIALQLSVFSFSTIRAQVFSMFFTVCLLCFFEQDDRGRRGWIALWLPLAVVWLNMHGGFLVGVGLLGLHAAERFARAYVFARSLRHALKEVRHLAFTIAATLLLVLVNPWGFDYVRALYYMVRLPRPDIPEWAPLWDIPAPGVMLSLFAVSLILVLYAVWARGVRDLPGLLLVVVTAYLGIRHIRHLPFYSLVWLCYVPGYLEGTELARTFHGIWDRRPRFVAALGLLLGLLGTYTAVRNEAWEVKLPTMPGQRDVLFPAGATDYLAQQGFAGNLMVPFEIGAFVSWKLYPGVKVSFDSRYEVAYPPAFYDEIARFYACDEGWQQTLSRYPTDAILLPRGSRLEAMLPNLTESPSRWRRVYQDDAYAVYTRSELAARLASADRSGEDIQGRFP